MKKIVFKDGTVITGESIGVKGNYFGEVYIEKNYFNYEKTLHDNEEIVLFTYPLIGNYGVTTFDPKAKAVILHELCEKPNHHQQIKTLNEALIEHQIIVIQQVDTRQIAKKLYGNPQKILICDMDLSEETIQNYFKGE